MSGFTVAPRIALRSQCTGNPYPTGEKITKAQMKAIPITRNDFHGEWNYTIGHQPITEPVQNKRTRRKTTK